MLRPADDGAETTPTRSAPSENRERRRGWPHVKRKTAAKISPEGQCASRNRPLVQRFSQFMLDPAARFSRRIRAGHPRQALRHAPKGAGSRQPDIFTINAVNQGVFLINPDQSHGCQNHDTNNKGIDNVMPQENKAKILAHAPRHNTKPQYSERLRQIHLVTM